MMRAARIEMGLRAAQTIMIGDTMETDILGGVQLGYKTVLVLTGGTGKSDLSRYAYQPDVVVDSIANLDTTALFLEHVPALAEARKAVI
jgi:NagD protein